MIPDESPSSPEPTIGHNGPPDRMAEVEEALQPILDFYRQRRDDFRDKAGAKLVTDRITASEAADILSLHDQVRSWLEEKRKDITLPYHNASRHGVILVEDFWEPAAEQIASLRERLEAWHLDEDARIAARQVEQRQMVERTIPEVQPTGPRPDIDYSQRRPPQISPERNIPAPQVMPPRRSKTRGDLGGRSQLRDEVVYRVDDVRALPDSILLSQGVQDAIQSAIKVLSRLQTDIPGTTRDTVAKLHTRR